MNKLPEGWAKCQLADIGLIVTGKTPSTKEPKFYGGTIPFIKPGDLDNAGPIVKTETCLTEAGLAEVPILPPKSIVVTCIGNLGKIGITTRNSATNQQINSVVPVPEVEPQYLFHYCRILRPWLEENSSATTISIINKGIFSSAPVLLPPLAEQTRIAQKLDELLAQVDTLKARIDGIPALLKRFRQSVLAAAVSGRLTEDLVKENSCQTQQRDLSYTSCTAFEGRAKISKFVDIFEIISGPAFKKAQYSLAGSKLLQIANVSYGKVVWDIKNFIPLDLAEEEKRFELAEGDIVMALNRPITNNTLKVAKIGLSDLPATLYQRVARFRLIDENIFNKDFLFIFFKTDQFMKKVQSELQGSDQPYINTSSLKDFEISLPSLEEQTEIVRRVEQLFTFADQLEAKVKTAQARVDQLTQSILAKAFRGELVPQDPNDEPASVLLERIKAQRAAEPKAKRGKKKAESV
ncbi:MULTISPECIES: restriction endonuclease subunit S [Pseudomonas]|uniref:Type I restriction enzyme, S subunit n=1 Tax=Pseudomonas lutea TaxID=243924 RepID=A0A9X8M8N5_9PSED|nr:MULTISPECIES: restriction endonuclease subunit S [Pseudomonas]SEP60107.1 type I restriction enzyme, S subunit [Pseudomonas lutea]